MKKEDIINAEMFGDSFIFKVNPKQKEAIADLRKRVLELMQYYINEGFPINFIIMISGDSKNYPVLEYKKQLPPEWKDKFNA